MQTEDYKHLIDISNEFKLSEDEILEVESASIALFLKKDKDDTLDTVKMKRMIGLAEGTMIPVGIIFSNPYNHYAYFIVVESDDDRALLEMKLPNK